MHPLARIPTMTGPDSPTHHPQPSLVWLASYPKSGNTWLRFLLYHYLYKEARHTDDLARKIPDIHSVSRLDVMQPKTLFCKTHYAMSDSHPYLSYTTAFIYIMRHPRDVLLSNLNYFRVSGHANNFDEHRFAHAFIDNLGAEFWSKRGIGNWPGHLESWLGAPRYPHLVLRYEQMLADPHTCLRETLQFLNIEIDERHLNRAVHQSSFEKLRSLELREKKRGKFTSVFSGTPEATQAGFWFMNKGQSGQTLAHLGKEIEEHFDERFDKALKLWGYK